MILLMVAQLFVPEVHYGGFSTYWPGDTCNTGNVLACDTPRARQLYKKGAWHVALRGVLRPRSNCGRPVMVCSIQTGRCVIAPWLDDGPHGRHPNGRYRGIVDVSKAVYRALGKPRFLSRVTVIR